MHNPGYQHIRLQCLQFGCPRLSDYIDEYTNNAAGELWQFLTAYTHAPKDGSLVIGSSTVAEPAILELRLRNPRRYTLAYTVQCLNDETDLASKVLVEKRGNNEDWIALKINNAVVKDTFRIKLNIENAADGRIFKDFEFPAITCDTPPEESLYLSVHIDGSLAYARWEMNCRGEHDDIERIVLQYKKGNNFSAPEEYRFDGSAWKCPGRTEALVSADPASGPAYNAFRQAFPLAYQDTVIQGLDFAVTLYDKNGFSSKAATPGFGLEYATTIQCTLGESKLHFSASNLTVNAGDSIPLTVNGTELDAGTRLSAWARAGDGGVEGLAVSGGGNNFSIGAPANPGKYTVTVSLVFRATTYSGNFQVTVRETVQPLSYTASDFAELRNIIENIIPAGKTATVTLLESVSFDIPINVTNKTIQLRAPGDSTRILARAFIYKGAAFTLGNSGVLDLCAAGGTLVIDGGAKLSTPYTAESALIQVNSGGKLLMHEGSVLRNNHNTAGAGGGVYSDGTIIMQGGIIEGNELSNGWGAGVMSFGTFIMEGGSIRGNATSTGNHGGGMVISSGTFTMKAGNISGNTATYGGGIYKTGGIFTMYGGSISGNSAAAGGGVFANNGMFTMYGGNISGNSATGGGGGGVRIESPAEFVMEGGTIFGNTAQSAGGGVIINNPDSRFIFKNGTISGNRAAQGGGVCVSEGTFTMSGGIIRENTVSDSGGGVYQESGNIIMDNGTISYNSAAVNGGGIYLWTGNLNMNNGSISNNTAVLGGGVYKEAGWTGSYPGAGTIEHNTPGP